MGATGFDECVAERLRDIRATGAYKTERVLLSPQQGHIRTQAGEAVNFCANNYLGLANHPEILEAARVALDRYGYGMASVRFICGTSQVHKELEEKVAGFLGAEDAILYSSCFDANAGLFETLFDERDLIVSDELNHASIIDGIRLSKARRERFAHGDLEQLESVLKSAVARIKVVATDGVFSMDGDVAKLDRICDLAERYGALVMVDDSHATGFFGATGRGSVEYRGVLGRVDLITSTFGKALGGASGGFTVGRRAVVELLRQRSRPYLFSNALSPVIASATLKAIDLITRDASLVRKLRDNTLYFRAVMRSAGFAITEGEHPIVPILLGEARRAQAMAEALLAEGIYVIGFSHPVVPKDKARIRIQISAAHERADLDHAVAALRKVGAAMGVVPAV
jgi:glycine C-acetyltransferase